MSSPCQLSDSQNGIPVLIGKDKNITYILDTSETMAAILGTVKNLIIQSLITKAALRNSLFNIITFSYKITSLSEHMIPCAPDTVYQALSWIHTLRTSPGNDLITALITAFSDPACQSVHLVMNSIPDNPGKCLNALSAFTTRPVHTFYISEKQDLDSDCVDFLKCLTSATKGSCYRLSLNSNAPAEQVNPSVSGEMKPFETFHYSTPHTTSSCQLQQHALSRSDMSFLTTSKVFLLHSSEQQMDRCQVSCCKACHAACISPYWCSTGNPFSVMPCVLRNLTKGAEFFPGCRVLARKEVDGFYYLGTIVHQLKDRGGLFMVTFDKGLTNDDTTREMVSPQLTCQPDMVNITQAHEHSLVPGDTVLAPWEPQMSRYGPGRVVSGTEVRDLLKGGEGNGLDVLFWNGIKLHIPKNLAVWIPASHHEQIIRGLQSNVFQPGCLSHSHCSYLNRSPVCCINQPNHCLPTTSLMCLCPVRSCPISNQCLFMDNQLKKQEIIPDQIKELVTSQEMKTDLSSSDFSEDEEEVANEKLNSTGLNLVSRSVNTDISYLKKAHTVPPSRPAWKYWKRESSEPHHKKTGQIAKPPNSDSCLGINNDSGYFSSSFSTKNHSSLFETVPHSFRRGITVKEVFVWSVQKTLSKEFPPLAFAIKKSSAEPRS